MTKATDQKPAPKVVECKKCGASIIWIAEELPDGTFKRRPFDAESPRMEWVRFGSDGRRVRLVRIWVEHRKTCEPHQLGD